MHLDLTTKEILIIIVYKQTLKIHVAFILKFINLEMIETILTFKDK